MSRTLTRATLLFSRVPVWTEATAVHAVVIRCKLSASSGSRDYSRVYYIIRSVFQIDITIDATGTFSTESIDGDGYISFKLTRIGKRFMFGLSRASDAGSTTYSTIDFARL
jgi:hypothetical protein